MLRLNANGSLDRTFGRDGYADLEHPQTEAPAKAVRLAIDGRDRIRVVAACSRAACGVQSWRLLADGTLDPTFVVSSISSPSPSAFPAALEAMPDGSSFALVVDPEDEMDGTSRLLRFAPDGQPTPLSMAPLNADLLTLHRRDQYLYVAGFRARQAEGRPGLGLIARLDGQGELTRDFGRDGVVELPVLPLPDSGLFPFAISTTASEVWVAGRALAPTNAPILTAIVKLNGNGAQHSGFGRDGFGLVSTSHVHWLAASLALDNNRRPVLSGFNGFQVGAGVPVASRFRSVDDSGPPRSAGVVALADSFAGAAEATRGVTVRVLRTGGAVGAASVEYETVDGTTSEGTDYRSVRGRLDWDEGDATDRVIELQFIDDAIGEPDERFRLRLQNPLGAQLAEPSIAEILIRDDDPVAVATAPDAGSLPGATATGSTTAAWSGGGGGLSGLELGWLLLLAIALRRDGGAAVPGQRRSPPLRYWSASPKRRPSAWIRS